MTAAIPATEEPTVKLEMLESRKTLAAGADEESREDEGWHSAHAAIGADAGST
jgi:hypothetical protein